ncbi:MAG: M3 family metallopeptidase [Alphaproteobacteria bacterium]
MTDSMTDNPLLRPSTLPNQAPAFDKIKLNHYLPAVEKAIAEARANIEAIKAGKHTPDFENSIAALESASESLGTVTSVFYNMLSAMGGDELQALAETIGPIGANFSSDIIMDEALFKRIKTVYDRKDALNLTAEQITLLDETYKDFVRGGALLDKSGKGRMREISAQLSVLSPDFMNNVKKSAEAFELRTENEADLAGLPQGTIDMARFMAEEKGYKGWLFTLDMPSYVPFMQYADRRDLREKIWRGYASRAWQDAFDNSENILKIARLKQERSQLLGYKNYAAYTLEERMAEKPDAVFSFLDKLKGAYKKGADEDLSALLEFAQKRDGLNDMKPWDVGYYSEKLKENLFHFSSEDLRPYFPLEKVLKGCFEHFSKLFNISFEPSKAYPTWHKDVQAFDVKNIKDGSFVGTLYADFYPREGKKDGAWMTAFRTQGLYRGKVERPLIAIVCNFTKPTPDKPSLLQHDEVTTLFHEMGHAIHGLLSDVTYRSLSGTNVLWDFVELPSQLQENWCYEKETLDLLADHYPTGAKIPNELIDKLVAAKNFMGAWAGLRQVALGTLDMAWYTKDISQIKDVAAFEEEQLKGLTMFPRMAGPISTSFSHIFAGGYGAGYYSYKWAEVLDADTFELFLERGLYNQEVAARYRSEILSKGGSEHPKILYKRFRERDPDPDALLRREGLLKKAA